MSLRAATVLATLVLFALPAGAQQDRVVVLENADSLVGLVIEGQDARELIGNVRLVQGTSGFPATAPCSSSRAASST